MSKRSRNRNGEENGHLTALETGFPILKISELAQQESWRKEVNRPLYHIHKWWARRLGSVFRAITLGALVDSDTDIWERFYKRHDLSGKVVLDPFMGSGTTLGEALKLGARAIGSDINPVSTFLVRQAFTQVPEAQLRDAFEKIKADVAPDIQRYYQTRDPESGELIPVLYYFWCKTVISPAGDVVPLFSRYVFAQNAYPKREPRAQVICPNCWTIIESRYDIASLDCPHCKHHFNPQDGPAKGQYVTAPDGSRHKIRDLLPTDGTPPSHRLYAMLALRPDGKKVYLPARSEDQALYAKTEVRLSEESLPLPTLQVRPGHNTNQARGYNYLYWRDFFNARQLLCLGMLLRNILKIEDQCVQEQMLCLFSSTLEFNNLFCSYKGEGTGAVRHMFSHHILKPERAPLENSIWGTKKSSGTFSTLFESRLLRAKRYLDIPFELQLHHDLFGQRCGTRKPVASAPLNPKCVSTWPDLQKTAQAVMVLNGDSASLPIPDESVDAVVTDPPYFDFVHYSELSDFFFAWLSPALADRYSWMNRADCSDMGEVQHKDPRSFSRQLARVFRECHRVLKSHGVLAFSFHHSRADGWAAIHQAIEDAGLVAVASYPVHAELRASSPKSATKDPISLDAILVCRKRETLSASNGPTCSPINQSEQLATELEACNVSISRSDRFVIAAAQMLINAGRESLGYEDILERLALLHDEVMNASPTQVKVVPIEIVDKGVHGAYAAVDIR